MLILQCLTLEIILIQGSWPTVSKRFFFFDYVLIFESLLWLYETKHRNLTVTTTKNRHTCVSVLEAQHWVVEHKKICEPHGRAQVVEKMPHCITQPSEDGQGFLYVRHPCSVPPSLAKVYWQVKWSFVPSVPSLKRSLPLLEAALGDHACLIHIFYVVFTFSISWLWQLSPPGGNEEARCRFSQVKVVSRIPVDTHL